MSRIVLGLVLAIACTRGSPDSLEAEIAAEFRARGAVPVSTSPEGSRVLVELPHDRAFVLHVTERTTGAVIAHRRDDDRAIAPVWRPDGGAIAYFRARDHRRAYDLRIWSLADGDDRAVFVPATATAFARFAPGGNRVAYLATDRERRRMLVVVELGALASPRAFVEVADRAEVEWSPDGARLATATATEPGMLTVVGLDGGEVRVPVVDGELRDLAWSPDGSTLAVTARGKDDEHLGLYRVDVRTQRVERVHPHAGDVHAPRFAGHALAYHVELGGERRIHVDGRPIGHAGASARLAGFVPSTATAIVIYRPRTHAAYVAAVPLAQQRHLDEPSAPRGDVAARIHVEARDGHALPAYVWRARQRPPAGAVVIVHGGPALHASPAWNEKIQLLVDAGHDVMKLDYRGSSGHGASFERLGGGAPVEAQVDDVLAARDHALRTTGLSADRVVLVGESYGAGLVAAAAARDRASPVVLVATLPLPAEVAGHRRGPVIAFHGADDDLVPPAAAHAHLQRLFGSAVRWRTLPREGHNLARTESWAAIYAAILRLHCRTASSRLACIAALQRSRVARLQRSARPARERHAIRAR
jgi:dipeptidyl aminopeptidase/acylaminoacyl peptidase